MRKLLLLTLCSLYVAGCSQPYDDDSGDPRHDIEKRPRPPHPGPDACVPPPPPDAPVPPPPDAPEPPPACADASQLDLHVFADEIMPILTGAVDLNDPEGEGFAGCARADCHGRDRGVGTLFIDAAGAPADNLSRFACFVDLDDPPASQILLCPLGDDSCVTSPHPGQDIFTGVDDLNYLRVLSFVETPPAAAAME